MHVAFSKLTKALETKGKTLLDTAKAQVAVNEKQKGYSVLQEDINRGANLVFLDQLALDRTRLTFQCPNGWIDRILKTSTPPSFADVVSSGPFVNFKRDDDKNSSKDYWEIRLAHNFASNQDCLNFINSPAGELAIKCGVERRRNLLAKHGLSISWSTIALEKSLGI